MHEYRNNLMFGKDEEKFYMWFRRLREPIVAPLTDFCVRVGLSPDHLSYMGLAMMIPFVYFFFSNPWISFIFLLLQLLFDGLDGPVARKLHKETAQGAFLDISADYLSFIIIFFTCLYVGLLSPFWAAGHVLNYAILQAFVFFARIKNIEIFPVVRPKLFFYLILFVWLLSNQNFFDPFLVVSTVYLIVSNFFFF